MSHERVRPIPAAVVLVFFLACVGCSSLPRNIEPPEPTYALEPTTEGSLADFDRACHREAGDDESGFLLVDRNDEAFHWRLALVDSAERSLDLMYYIWKGDYSGKLLLERVRMAADRGVRVRVLVDDFPIRGSDRIVATLDTHPNIEIRIFNPWRQRKLGRNLEFLARIGELNHRMHNKILTADGHVVISGGRNIGDEYFGIASKYNFHDLDVVGVGPVVPKITRMFDRYWNSTWIVPAAVLDKRASIDDLPDVSEGLRDDLSESPYRECFPIERGDWASRLAGPPDAMSFGWAEAIYDDPTDGTPTMDATYGLQRFFGQANEEILCANPYFIPGDAFYEDVGAMTDRGIRVAILTNSLGSNDNALVNSAYAKKRRPVLEAGAELYELKHEPAIRSVTDTPPASPDFIGLHLKAAVLDRTDVFVGSFNFDPRSRNINTEMGILVHCPRLAGQLVEIMERDMSPENAWRLRLDDDGRLAWESSDGTLTKQPARGFLQRFQSGFFGVLPIEDQL